MSRLPRQSADIPRSNGWGIWDVIWPGRTITGLAVGSNILCFYCLRLTVAEDIPAGRRTSRGNLWRAGETCACSLASTAQRPWLWHRLLLVGERAGRIRALRRPLHAELPARCLGRLVVPGSRLRLLVLLSKVYALSCCPGTPRTARGKLEEVGVGGTIEDGLPLAFRSSPLGAFQDSAAQGRFDCVCSRGFLGSGCIPNLWHLRRRRRNSSPRSLRDQNCHGVLCLAVPSGTQTPCSTTASCWSVGALLDLYPRHLGRAARAMGDGSALRRIDIAVAGHPHGLGHGSPGRAARSDCSGEGDWSRFGDRPAQKHLLHRLTDSAHLVSLQHFEHLSDAALKGRWPGQLAGGRRQLEALTKLRVLPDGLQHLDGLLPRLPVRGSTEARLQAWHQSRESLIKVGALNSLHRIDTGAEQLRPRHGKRKAEMLDQP
mmetsp:Transcript_46972/g.102184  ORF Transcript_46972/g.102184 Transcript_46972/m.102184 type:complete len:431 (+) Transcript_46972:1756-3048(+)